VDASGRPAPRSAVASVGPTRFFGKYGAQGNSWAIFKTFLEQQHRYLAGLDPMTGEPDPVIQGFLEWPKP